MQQRTIQNQWDGDGDIEQAESIKKKKTGMCGAIAKSESTSMMTHILLTQARDDRRQQEKLSATILCI
jgi:hypothetical protein